MTDRDDQEPSSAVIHTDQPETQVETNRRRDISFVDNSDSSDADDAPGSPSSASAPVVPDGPPPGINSYDWKNLCDMIRQDRCVPIVGALAREPVVPNGSLIARKWAVEVDYPLRNVDNLAEVAQFVETKLGGHAPTDQLEQIFGDLEERAEPDWMTDQHHPLVVLAQLGLSLYVTTAYDRLLTKALKTYRHTDPLVLSSQWQPPTRNWLAEHPPVTEVNEAHRKRPPTPIVLHLHGRYDDSDSMVLTELDHMRFNEQLALDLGDNRLIDPTVRNKMAGDALLFIGFSYGDRNFRGLLRNLSVVIENTRPTIAVQLPSDQANPDKLDDAREYLTRYFGLLRGKGRQEANVQVFWGSGREFMAYLRRDVL